jgi:hypothetical protein
MKIKHIVIEGSEEDITVRATADGATASVVRMSRQWNRRPLQEARARRVRRWQGELTWPSGLAHSRDMRRGFLFGQSV